MGIFHTDSQGRVTYINERWTEISGLNADASRGHRWARVLHEADRQRVLDDWLTCAAAGSEYVTDYRLIRPSGETRFVHAHAAPILTPTGRLRGYVGTVEDVTDRRLAERELQRSVAALELSGRRLQALFENSLDAILLTDDWGQYVEANPAACELFGYSLEELLTRSILDVATPAKRQAFEAQWRLFLSTREHSGEYTLLRADGTARAVEFRVVAHVLPGTHLVILRDITERKRTERAQQQYVQRLEILAAIDRAALDLRSIHAIADATLEQISRLFSARRVSVVLFDPPTETARIVAVWSRDGTELGPGITMPMRTDVTGREVLEGRAVLVSNLAGAVHATWIDSVLFKEGVRSYLRAPLRTKSDIIGTLNISSSEADAFVEAQLDVAQEVADRLAVAITNVRLFEEVQATSARVAAMSKRLLEVQEAERRDIGRELHDEIGQVLTALKLRLDLVVQTAPAPLASPLRESHRLLDDLVATVRRLTLDLRPALLDESGLGPALLAHFESYTEQTGIQVSCTAVGLDDRRFPLGVEMGAYRIVQESLTNVARHAEVEHVQVNVRVESGARSTWTLPIKAVDSTRGCHRRTPRD